MKLLIFLLPLLLQGGWGQPGEKQHVSPVSVDGREFRGAFNATADRPRLVMVFSPT